MRYVSKIVTPNGEVNSLFSYSRETLDHIVVYDTKTGREEIFRYCDMHNSDCYGVVVGRGLLVKHDLKTAFLYRFVRSVQTEGCKPSISLDYYDIVDIGQGLPMLDGHRKIAITTPDEDIRAIGRCGSVCVRQSVVTVSKSLVTLYDLLGDMCRRTGINVLDYDEICFYSEKLFYVSRISLLHSHEANLFFTKMLWDSLRR